MLDLSINTKTLETIFPHFFVAKKTGQIIHAGGTMLKSFGKKGGKSKMYFDQFFEILTPSVPSHLHLTTFSLGEPITLKMKNLEKKFIGKVVRANKPGTFIFFLCPFE